MRAYNATPQLVTGGHTFSSITNGSANNSEIYCTLLTTPAPVPALGGPPGTVGARAKPPIRARR